MIHHQWTFGGSLAMGRSINLRTFIEDGGAMNPTFNRMGINGSYPSPWPYQVPGGTFFALRQATIDTKFSAQSPSSYLILSGVFALPDNEHSRQWFPPLIIMPGSLFDLVLTNSANMGQNMICHLSGAQVTCILRPDGQPDLSVDGITLALNRENRDFGYRLL